MVQFFIGALLLIAIYALIPKRFSIFAEISKENNYSRKENIMLSIIVGGISLVPTLLIGLLFFWLGSNILHENKAMMEIVAPLVLIIVGIIYLGIHVKGDIQDKSRVNIEFCKDKDKDEIMAYLFRREFLIPNVMLAAYCFPASFFQTTGFVSILIMYFIIGLAGVVFLSDMVYRGVGKVKIDVLAKHNEELMGAMLIGLGIFFYFTGL